MRNLDS